MEFLQRHFFILFTNTNYFNMKIYEETNIRDFKFWGGAEDRITNLTDKDWDLIEPELEMLYPDGMSDDELNGIFWFEFDMIAQILGYENEEDFDRKRDPSYLDDDELEEYVEAYWRDYLDIIFEEQGESVLRFIVTDLFGDEPDEVLEDYKEEAFDKSPKGILYHYLNTHYDSSELMKMLFDNDQGWDVLDDFPTKEEFRNEMMDKKKTSK